MFNPKFKVFVVISAIRNGLLLVINNSFTKTCLVFFNSKLKVFQICSIRHAQKSTLNII